jgi:nicotinamidase-related amidase
MTSLFDRSGTALLVIDMQNGVVANTCNRDAVVGNISTLVDKARAEGVPVVWVQHSDDGLPEGSPAWEYVPELARRDDEPLVHKHYGDSFEATTLEALLAGHAVGRLVITCAQTDACIRSTLHGALVRGYDTTLVEDAHATEDLRPFGAPIGPEEAIAYTNLYWRYSAAPGRIGATTPTAEIEFTPAS